MSENFTVHIHLAVTGPLTAALLGAGVCGAVATFSPLHSPAAPRVGFPALLAGPWGILLAYSAASVAARLFGPSPSVAVGFAVGYGFGVLAGLDAGRRLATYYLREVWPGRAGRANAGPTAA